MKRGGDEEGEEEAAAAVRIGPSILWQDAKPTANGRLVGLFPDLEGLIAGVVKSEIMGSPDDIWLV